MALSVVLSLSYNQLIKPKLILVMGYSFCCSVLLVSVETETVRLMLEKWGRRGLTAGILRELGGYHWCSAIPSHFPAPGLPPPSEHTHEWGWMLCDGELSSPPMSQLWEKSVDVSVLSSHFPSNHLVLGTITPCCDWTLPMFPSCIWHKEEKALLQNWPVFEGTFMYTTGTCKPSFQIKSSKKNNLISGGNMFMSNSWSFCLVYSISKRLKHPRSRDKKE